MSTGVSEETECEIAGDERSCAGVRFKVRAQEGVLV